MCPALLQKPPLPTPHFDLGATEAEKVKHSDPFKSPYNPNLYVGELKDEEEGTEYVVLVSGCATVVPSEPITTKSGWLNSSTSTLSLRSTFFWSPRVSRTVSGIARLSLNACLNRNRIPEPDVAIKSQRSRPGVSPPSCGAQGRKASVRLLQLCVHALSPPLWLDSGLKLLFGSGKGGDRSGASQAHKHLQFLPTTDEEGPPIERLARAAHIDKEGRYQPTPPLSNPAIIMITILPCAQKNRSPCPPSPSPTTSGVSHCPPPRRMPSSSQHYHKRSSSYSTYASRRCATPPPTTLMTTAAATGCRTTCC